MLTIKSFASGSSGNCYSVNDGKTTILLDAGISYKKIQQCLDFRIHQVSGVLITHRHGDHSKAVPDLIKAGVNVYANEDVFKAVGSEKYAYRCNKLSNCIDENGIVTSKAVIGTFDVISFDCEHDVPILGFYIKSRITGDSLLYFTDTYYIKPKFNNLNYIMAECNYSIEILNRNILEGRVPIEFKKRLVHSHMSIDTLEKTLKEYDLSQIKEIYLLHLSDRNSNEDEFKKRIQAITGCQVYIC